MPLEIEHRCVNAAGVLVGLVQFEGPASAAKSVDFFDERGNIDRALIDGRGRGRPAQEIDQLLVGKIGYKEPAGRATINRNARSDLRDDANRSEEHTSELQSLMRISYAVFCLKKITQPH